MNNSIFKIAPNIIKKPETDNCLILLNMNDENHELVYKVKGFSINIYNRIDGSMTVNEIIDDIKVNHSYLNDEFESDALNFLSNLESEGLILEV